MEITYERKHSDSYMIIDGTMDKDSYEYKMIKANNISCLLDISEYAIDGQSKLSYKISRKENLEDFVESHDMDVDTLARFFINLKLALQELEKYFIDERHIWLDKEGIYLEKATDSYKLSLCYFPKDFGTIQEQLRPLMEYFLSQITSMDKRGSKELYVAYDLCLKEDFTLDEIIDCLINKDDSEEEIYVEKVSIEDGVDMTSPVDESEYLSDFFDMEEEKKDLSLAKRFVDAAKNLFAKKQEIEKKSLGLNFTDDFVVEPDFEIEEPTVLLTDTAPVGKLVYDGNRGEDDFIINKDIFRIGSSKNNDAILKNKTISGNHAKITKEGDDYYLTDSNSLNGSFINNKPLIYRKPYKLRVMDEIRFAGESFVFM